MPNNEHDIALEPLNKDTFRTSHFVLVERLSSFRSIILSACPFLGGLSCPLSGVSITVSIYLAEWEKETIPLYKDTTTGPKVHSFLNLEVPLNGYPNIPPQFSV